ncbi:hypothetical protein M446_4720 [Methylobacterium sp. 4-46]|nr:hypothetical protein M446_4720 [Methylobacterium sp. 4-46]
MPRSPSGSERGDAAQLPRHDRRDLGHQLPSAPCGLLHSFAEEVTRPRHAAPPRPDQLARSVQQHDDRVRLREQFASPVRGRRDCRLLGDGAQFLMIGHNAGAVWPWSE